MDSTFTEHLSPLFFVDQCRLWWVRYTLVISVSLAPLFSFATPAMDTVGALDSETPMSAGLGSRPSATYFNPALLAWSKEQVSVGFIIIHQDLQLTFHERPREANVDRSIYGAVAIDPESTARGSAVPLPTSDIPNRSLSHESNQQVFLSSGLIKPLIKEKLNFGLNAMVPLHRFELQSPNYIDERAQYFGNQLSFERWSDNLEGLSVSAGLGISMGDQFSLGLSGTMLNRAVASSQVFLSDASYQGLSVISPRVEVYSVISPSASIAWRAPLSSSPTSYQRERRGGLRSIVFVTIHAPEDIEVKGRSDVKIWNYPYAEGESSIQQSFEQTYRVVPLRIRWGALLPLSILGLSERIALFTGGVWSQWSKYRNRSAERALWSDQVEASGGALWRGEISGLSGDLRWRPSPVPEQSGRTSYVDPHQLALNLSAYYTLTSTLRLQLNLQGHYLLPRTDRKSLKSLTPVIDEFPASQDELTGDLISSSLGVQSNNPGYPGYDSQGVVWVGGLSIVWSIP